jgi:hypothetical protein
MLLCFLGGVATLVTSGFLLLLTSRFVTGLGHLTTSYLAMTLGMCFYNVSCNLIMLQSALYEYINFDAFNIIIGFITDRVIQKGQNGVLHGKRPIKRPHNLL